MTTADPKRCVYCGAAVAWFETETGARMPINREPDPAGNVILLRPRAVESDVELEARRVHVLKRDESPPEGTERYMPHTATCLRKRPRRSTASRTRPLGG